jgi:hypothetical protein
VGHHPRQAKLHLHEERANLLGFQLQKLGSESQFAGSLPHECEPHFRSALLGSHEIGGVVHYGLLVQWSILVLTRH